MLAVITTTTENFLPGTLVSLTSFRKHNPWFSGRILVLHEGLSDAGRAQLEHCVPGVDLRAISAATERALTATLDRHPHLKPRRARFLSLDAFSLHEEFDQILLIDSDLLFLDSVQALFDLSNDLVCAGDGPWYQGLGRHRRDGAKCPRQAEDADIIERPFNSGLLLAGSGALNPSGYAALINDLTDNHWPAGSAWDDQGIFNRVFDGRQHLISARYNYLTKHRRSIQQSEGLRPEDAAVLHFNNRVKPWQSERFLHLARVNPGMLPLVRQWQEAYWSVLRTLADSSPGQ